ncbi:hypothetical protein RF11_08353 [Thelohanellus kitauei]|uniref:Vacuolar protein sorting/targeting protein 10 n=1 Tax=Thelohanellus kitauei TaxID=669202 RepID=A0A0C2MRK9_THEKT|nr:hypothetical protein RF11_08353 [Thelohanellus kitauei]
MIRFSTTEIDKSSSNDRVHVSKVFFTYYQDKVQSTTELSTTDGGKTIHRWTPKIDGQPTYVEKIFTIKNILFGITGLSREFFYADTNFNIFSVQKLERNESVFPSDFRPSYIYKLVSISSQSFENTDQLRIINLDKSTDNLMTVIDARDSGYKFDSTLIKKYKEGFFSHGNLYFLAWNRELQLCLCTTNHEDKLIPLVCDIHLYNEHTGKCSFIVHPHLYGVIFANLNINHTKVRSFVSFDNGKYFKPLEFIKKSPNGDNLTTSVEFDLTCTSDYIRNHFPRKEIVQFYATYHVGSISGRHIFVSYNGGKNWMKQDSRIAKLMILDGSLRLAVEKNIGYIWYSYERNNSHFIRIGFKYIIDIIQLKSTNHLASDDYETWYVPRFYGECFQGNIVSYLKKKPFAKCHDRRTSVLPTIESCPCSILDLHW